MKRIKSVTHVFGLTTALIAMLITSNLSVYFERVCPSARAVVKAAPLSEARSSDRSDQTLLGSDTIGVDSYFSTPLPEPNSVDKVKLSQAYGKLPLSFEANQGQADPHVNFTSNCNGYRLFLTPTEAVVAFSDLNQKTKTRNQKPAAFHMRLVGANSSPQVEGLDQLPTRSNYFIGSDATKWRTDIPNFGRVKYEEVYPGVDLIYHGNQQQLEYDFLVAAGANPRAIKMAFEGVRRMYVDSQGDLLLHTSGGYLRQHKPIAYQEVDGIKKEISCRFIVKGKCEIGFQVAGYDITKPLVIDPVLNAVIYSTYLGDSGVEMGLGIAVESSSDNVYVTGVTSSASFDGSNDVFVTKLNNSGTSVLYSVFLGGSGNDRGHAIAVAWDNTAYVTGQTSSGDFPIYPKPNIWDDDLGGVTDAFIAKLSSSGSVIFSTFLGGDGIDSANGIAVDSSLSAYVTGFTSSLNFPHINAYQPLSGGGQDAFVTKIAGGGGFIYYSTYLGGNFEDTGVDIAVDPSATPSAHVIGSTKSTNFPTFGTNFGHTLSGTRDAFATVMSFEGTTTEFSAYLGGNNVEDGFRIVAPTAQTFYVTGATSSPDFPTRGLLNNNLRGLTDAFVMGISGGTYTLSGYLGGSYIDKGYGIACFGSSIYLTGETYSSDFPTTGVDTSGYSGGRDAFVTILDSDDGFRRYSTYLGGSGDEDGRRIAASTSGIYVTGYTKSSNFPRKNTNSTLQGSQDAFVTKFYRRF